MIFSTNKINSQLLWLSKPELESIVQPLLHLLGNVAAKCPRDLWGSDNQLCRQNIRADENELPKHDWAEGADNFTHQGFAK